MKESQIGAEEVEYKPLGGRERHTVVLPVGDPIDIGPLFVAAGLVRVELDCAPKWSYPYRKPKRPLNPSLE